MYAFIWRHLPGNLAAKLAGTLLLLVLAGLALWYGVFPWLEPRVALDEVTVG
ncbi:hypothetical protein [Herbidospora daliensis]|uniref:hypothetical protein n=1 Tax=Herbidospora daliensis TaxID=295585 RepID=UPI000B2FDDA0|nr:hypothetical protein [Herbidospora daliensis]